MKELLVGILVFSVIIIFTYFLGHLNRIVSNIFGCWHTTPENFNDTLLRGCGTWVYGFIAAAGIAALYGLGSIITSF